MSLSSQVSDLATTIGNALKAVKAKADAAATQAYVDSGLAGKANTTHFHTASQISNSTVTGQSLMTAANAAAARAVLGDTQQVVIPGSNDIPPYRRLAVVDGGSADAGSHISFLFSGLGNYGDKNRGTALIHMGQREQNNPVNGTNIWVWGGETNNIGVFYAVQISSFKYELWWLAPQYTMESRITVLSGASTATIDGVTTATSLPANTPSVPWRQADVDQVARPKTNNILLMDSSTTTATINAFLAQGGYRALRGTALLTNSLIIPSNTHVDANGADITGVANRNILQNAAAVPARTVTTGASTAGSTTLTASGAAFTSTDVGRQVEVLAAGPNTGRAAAPGSWYGTVVSVTNSTTVVLSVPANLTTSGSTVYIYPARDTNITIEGGVWRPQNKNSLSQQQEGHGFRLRRLDNSVINNVTLWGPNVPQMGGQYAISLGDVTRSVATNLRFQDVNSDGIHYQGPANGIIIQNVEAQNSGDDLVAFTPVDGQSQNASRLGDTEGDIYDVSVSNVTGYGVLSHLKIAGGTGPGGVLRKLTKFNLDGLYGVTKGNAPVNIVDYAGTTTFSGRIANVHAVGLTNTAAVITSTASNVLNLTAEDIHWPAAQGVPSTGVVNIGGVLHRKVIVRNVHYAATSGASTDLCPAVYVSCTNVDYLEVDGTFATDPNTPNFIAVQIASALVSQRLIVSRHQSGTGASGNAVYFTGTNWDIQHMSFREIHRYTGSWIDGTGTATATTNIVATNCTGGSAWILLRQPANINISSCSQSTDRASGAGIRLIGTTAAANITVTGSQRNGVLTSIDGTQSCRILECTCIVVTDSTVTAAGNGDIYRNTTSLRLRSSGAWKNL